MALSILQNVTAIGTNLTTAFGATSGATPYSYSVLPGGAGGSINDSTGVYVSPNATGIDTIQVTDDDDATATAEILVGNTLELFCDVIQAGMNLSEGRVFLWDQKLMLPSDAGLFVAVSVLNCKAFGNTRKYDATSGFNQVQSVNMLALLSLDIISGGPEARDRKEEVIMAFNSTYSQQQQELNSFHIGQLSTNFINLSQLDGSRIPYRFQINLNLQYLVTKTSSVPYFDTFSDPSVLTNT